MSQGAVHGNSLAGARTSTPKTHWDASAGKSSIDDHNAPLFKVIYVTAYIIAYSFLELLFSSTLILV